MQGPQITGVVIQNTLHLITYFILFFNTFIQLFQIQKKKQVEMEALIQDLLHLRAGLVREKKRVEDLLNTQDITIKNMTVEIERLKKQNKQLRRKAMKLGSEESSPAYSFSVKYSPSNLQEIGRFTSDSHISITTTMSDSGCDIVEDDCFIANNEYTHGNFGKQSHSQLDFIMKTQNNIEKRRQPNPKKIPTQNRQLSPQDNSANNILTPPVISVSDINSVKPPVASRDSVNRKLNIVSSSGVRGDSPVKGEMLRLVSDKALGGLMTTDGDQVMVSESTPSKDAVSGNGLIQKFDQEGWDMFTFHSDALVKHKLKSVTGPAELNREEKGSCDCVDSHNIQHTTGYVKSDKTTAVCDSDEHTNKTIMTYWTEHFL